MPDEDDEEEGSEELPKLPDGSVDFDEIERQHRVKFPPRELTPEDKAVIDELWRRKLLQTSFEAVEKGEEIPPTHAYCTTTADMQMSKWNGHHPPEKNTRVFTIPAGTVLKIVVISRMGDFGLTNDLTADFGYGLRVLWDDARITNLRWEP